MTSGVAVLRVTPSRRRRGRCRRLRRRRRAVFAVRPPLNAPHGGLLRAPLPRFRKPGSCCRSRCAFRGAAVPEDARTEQARGRLSRQLPPGGRQPARFRWGRWGASLRPRGAGARGRRACGLRAQSVQAACEVLGCRWRRRALLPQGAGGRRALHLVGPLSPRGAWHVSCVLWTRCLGSVF